MKPVARYITLVPIQNQETNLMNVSLGYDKNGHIEVFFGDTSELEQDSNYINEDSFPNTGLLASGKYSLWMSMFSRHIKTVIENEDEL